MTVHSKTTQSWTSLSQNVTRSCSLTSQRWRFLALSPGMPGHQSWAILCRQRTMQPQTKEQRGERACALTARGSISKAMKGLVGGAASGSAERRKHCTTALIPRSSGQGTHPSNADRTRTTLAA